MPDTGAASFLAAYVRATNSHDIDRIVPHIAADATYWFSDGSFRGVPAIAAAISRTFATIHDEVYEISDVEWVVQTPDTAVCRYRFAWRGLVDGVPRTGAGRGTNVLVRRDGSWAMLHEHLSP